MKHQGKKNYLAIFLVMAMVVSSFSGIAFSVNAATPIEVIQEYAANDNAAAMTIAELTAAGVTTATALNANLAAYKVAIAASTPNGTDTVAEIQAIVDAVNLAQAIALIEAYGAGAAGLTIDQLTAAGVTGTIGYNLDAYKTAIGAAAVGAADTTAEIQNIINTVNTSEATTAVTTIKGYITTDAAALTTDLLTKAGVTGIVNGNLARYKAAINALAEDVTLLDSTAKIQALVNSTNTTVAAEVEAAAALAAIAAIDAIKDYAANDDASALTSAQLLLTRVPADSVINANLASYQTAIAAATPLEVDTKGKIQTILDGLNASILATQLALEAAINAIKGYAGNDDASALTIVQLTNAGVTGAMQVNIGTHNANIANSTGYIKAIENTTAVLTDTTAEIQAIINAVNLAEATAAIDTIKALPAGAADLTIDLLTKAGIPTSGAGATVAANLARYKVVIGAALSADRDTTPEIQTIISLANTTAANAATAIAAIEAYDATTVSALTLAQLVAAEVTKVDANLAAYKVAIGAAAVGAADTQAEIQAIVTAVDNAEAKAATIATIEGYDAGTVAALTIAQLTSIGITGTITGNLAEYKLAIGAAAALAADTQAEIQAIINAANLKVDTIAIIRGYAANDDASTLTINELVIAGVTGTVDANLAAYKPAIENATANNADTTAKIQTIINTVNAAQTVLAIAAIEAYGAGAAGLTMTQLSIAGVTGAVSANLDLYKASIGAAAVGAADTIGEIQALITGVNTGVVDAAVLLIKGYAANDDASALTLAKLTEAGVTGIIDANLAVYKIAIAAATAAAADTTAEIQTIITNTNAAQVTNALNAIIAYATNDNAAGLTISQLATAGVSITGANAALEANLAQYKVAIAAAAAADVDTAPEIQGIIDTVNTAVLRAAAIASISSYTGNAGALTIAQLVTAGVVGALDANLAYYKTAIAATASASMDTTAEIQAVINSANALVSAIAYIEGLTGGDALTIAQLTATGVTGTLDANLAAYKAAIVAAAALAADTTAEIQVIINAVNATAIADAILVIKGYAENDNSDILLLAAKLTAAGVTGLVDSNTAAYKIAIDGSTGLLTDTTAKIQAIINTVNFTKSIAAIASITIGDIVDSTIVGSLDMSFAPDNVIDIPASVTLIRPSNFAVEGEGTLTLYTNSDYATGLVTADGTAISGNTTLYAKVVSADGITKKYFVIVLNVVVSGTKYTLENTEFALAGTNYVANVTIDRGQAATLANPKLLVIYTLASGAQVFLTQSVSDSIEIVVPVVGFIRVQVVLIDGAVDWSAGDPVAKSDANTITIPAV